MRAPRLGGVWVVLVLLAGCATRPVAPVAGSSARLDPARFMDAQAARESAYGAHPVWKMTGRLAVHAGEHGGSGRLEWRQDGADFEIVLSAPITRQGWRLSRHGEVVRLEGLEGGPRSGTDPERLLWEATGWRLPVMAMAGWLQGLRTGPGATLTFAETGLPATLSEQGWQVEYREWDRQVPPRPRRIFAEQPGASVRLVIERWDQP